MDINQIFPIFAALVGFPAFLAATVNALKYFGVLQDGQAPAVVFYANLAALVGVGVLYFTGNLPLLSQIDSQLGSLATFVVTLIAFIVDLGGTKLFHFVLRGSPVIGTSFTAQG